MGSLSENVRPGRIARGIIYPMVILLIILFTFEIISLSFKSRSSTSLEISQTTGSHDIASKARLYTTSGKLGNDEAHELLLESLTLLRDVMLDVKGGSKGNPFFRQIQY